LEKERIVLGHHPSNGNDQERKIGQGGDHDRGIKFGVSAGKNLKPTGG